ncbi:MAG: hypothetical protein OIF54_09915, partial [Cohaesibacter sp.]|nr:hypothetical protein [Cohaesibacter sp.]
KKYHTPQQNPRNPTVQAGENIKQTTHKPTDKETAKKQNPSQNLARGKLKDGILSYDFKVC